MKRPFLAIWISYMAGMYLDYNLNIEQESYKFFIVLTGIVLLSAKIILKKSAYTFALMLSLLMGGLFFNLDYCEFNGIDDGGKVEDIFRVLEVQTAEEGFERYIAEAEDVGEKMLLTSYKNIELEMGDIVQVKGEAEEIRTNTNPKLFNPRDYYRSRYIYGNIVARDISVLDRDKLSILERYSKNFRHHVEDTVDYSLKSGDGDIVKSMLLGDSSYIEGEKLEKMRSIGLGHMLAVSGLHIGIIFGMVMFALWKMGGFHKRISEITSLALIWIYIALIGFPVSSVRAGIVITLLVLSKLTHRKYDTLNVLSFAGLVMVLFRPLWVLGIGYQLSFAGVISLSLAKGGKLKSLMAIFLGLLPMNMYYFNTVPVVSIASNLTAVPVLSLSLVMSSIMVIVYGVSEGLSRGIGVLIDLVLYLENGIAAGLEVLHREHPSASPNGIELMLWYILILVILKVIDIRRYGKRIMASFVVYLAIVSTVAMLYPEQAAKVEFLDVGQGDCAIISVSGKTYMIDSGGSPFSDYDVGEHMVYPYLLKNGIEELDGFIASHFDADHVKGFLYVMDKVRVREIIIGHHSPDNELFNEIMKVAEEKGIAVKHIGSPSVLELDSENSLLFLPPDKGSIKNGENDSSLVVLLESFKKRILFTGDIEESRESKLSDIGEISNVDVISVPHHGSKTSSTESFLKHTAPKLGVVQVGKNNFGHPNPEVMERYENFETEIYRNDESGMVELTVKSDAIRVEETLGEKLTIGEAMRLYDAEILAVLLYIWVSITLAGMYRPERLERISNGENGER